MSVQEFISALVRPLRKYEMLSYDTIKENGKTLYRIRALKDFGPVRKGDLGGYIEAEKNLSHNGGCWVFGDARVCDDARVTHNAMVGGKAAIDRNGRVAGMAWIHDEACVSDEAEVAGYATIGGEAKVAGRASVEDHAVIGGSETIAGNTQIGK